MATAQKTYPNTRYRHDTVALTTRKDDHESSHH